MNAWSGFAELCALLLYCAGAWAADYYVDPGGQDGAGRDGSPAQPWRTVTYAIGQVSAGATIHLTGGTNYVENLYFAPGSGGAPGSPITLTSVATNRAVLAPVGTNDVACYIYNTGHLVFEHLRFVGPGSAQHAADGVNAYSDSGQWAGLTFSNVSFTGFGKSGLVIGGWDGATNGFRDVLVTDCTAYDNLRCGLQTYGEYSTANNTVTIRNSRVYENPGDPALASNSGSGIVLGGLTHGLIEYCVAYSNGMQCTAGEGPVGIWAYASTDVVIQHCEAYQNRTGGPADGGGFDLDGGCRDCVIQYCYSHENDGAGYLICQYSGASAYSNNVVRYNISQNDGGANGYGAIHFYSSGSSGGIRNCDVYANTVFVSQQGAVSPPAVRFASGGISDVRVLNNLLIATNGMVLVSGSVPVGKAKFEGNAYWTCGGPFDAAGYSSLAAWRDATGQETHAGEPTGVRYDPLLADAGGGGIVGDPHTLSGLEAYRLRDGSPLTDAGLSLTNLFGVAPGGHDFFGVPVPQRHAYDIGAAESTSTAVRVTLVPSKSVWRYTDTGADLGTAWRAPDVDESTWPTGRAVFGYGEPFVDTELSYGGDPDNKHITSYFRQTFECPYEPASIDVLRMFACCDDGMIAYLNGHEVARVAMPTGAVTYLTTALNHEAGAYEHLDLSAHKDRVVPGLNVLAVELHQTSVTSSDLAMAVELVLERPAGVVRVTKVAKGGTWKYRKGTAAASTPQTAWRRNDFDDGAWPESAAPFGYSSEPEEGPFGTALTNMRNEYVAVFLRKAFEVPIPALVDGLNVAAEYDDGFVLWLNAEEIARVNMGGAPGTFLGHGALALATVEPTNWTARWSGPDLPDLRAGTNILAVQAFNGTSNSSDFKIDIELTVLREPLSVVVDADQDGMPDAWEDATLGGTAAMATGDPDGDGVVNLAEYTAGTAPATNAGAFELDLSLSNGQVWVAFPTVQATGTGYEAVNRYYVLEARTNLDESGLWRPIEPYTNVFGDGEPVLCGQDIGGTNTVVYRARTWLRD